MKTVAVRKMNFERFGSLTAFFDDNSIIRLLFENDNEPEAEDAIKKHFAGVTFSHAPNGLSLQCERELEAYFCGKLFRFSIPVKPFGTQFDQTVWKALTELPYGQTVSYGRLAEKAGFAGPLYARAVGNAVGRNPIPILIPCHRVVRSDGRLGGFSGGIDKKRKLLEIEGVLTDGGHTEKSGKTTRIFF